MISRDKRTRLVLYSDDKFETLSAIKQEALLFIIYQKCFSGEGYNSGIWPIHKNLRIVEGSLTIESYYSLNTLLGRPKLFL